MVPTGAEDNEGEIPATTIVGPAPSRERLTPDRAIARFALYFTAPSYWLGGHASNLTAFLKCLLDPSNPGFASVGVRANEDEEEDDTLRWIEGEDAIAHIQEWYERRWLPAEQRIVDGDGGDGDALLEEFVKSKASLFLDHVRFEACCAAYLPNDRRASYSGEHDPGPYWIGLTIDWAQPSGPIAWFPQFRVYSYWPESPQFAPPREDHPGLDDGRGRRATAEVAAAILDEFYWRVIETDFRNLRMLFQLGMANTGDFEPPVFFVAEPAVAPATPEGYMEDEWWEVLAALGKNALRTSDPFASTVATAVLDGRFALFSNVHQSRLKQKQDYCLVLPADAATFHHAFDEQRLYRLADQLAFIHFSAARNANIVIDEASLLRQKLRVQRSILSRTSETAQRILNLASAAGGARLNKADGELRQLGRELQLVVELMKMQFSHSELEIRGLEADLARGKAFNADDLTRRLAVRPTHRGRALSGADIAPTVVATTDVEALRRDGAREVRDLEQLKTTFDGVLAHVAQSEREREERTEKTFSYLLVFLAAIVAFPLLTGHMDWKELAATLNRGSTFGSVAWATHAVVTWTSVVAAVAGILALALFLALRFARVRAILSAPFRSSSSSHRSRDEIAAIWFKLAEREQVDGARVTTAALSRYEEDERVLKALAAESSWLLENAIEDGMGEPVAGLRARVATVGALSEIFMHRPNPLTLPTTLLFLRFCGPRFFREWVGSEVVSDHELMVSFYAGGMTVPQTREQLERLRADERLLTARTIEELAAAADAALFEQPPAPDHTGGSPERSEPASDAAEAAPEGTGGAPSESSGHLTSLER
jgi:hypothetical protein